MRFFAIGTVLFAVAASVFAIPVAQHNTTQSAATILTNLRNKVTALAHQLRYATCENMTEANLKPIINEMSMSVTSAVSTLKLLSGKPTTVVLGSLDGAKILFLGASVAGSLIDGGP